MGKAIDTSRDNLGYFNPPNVYRPAIIDIRLVGEYSAEDGATNTYRITQNDGKIFEFDVKNGSGGSAGRSVTSVEQIQVSTESLGKNVARITLSDGTYTDVEIRNGAQGPTGPRGPRGPEGINQVEATIGTNDPTQAPSVDKDLTEGVLSLTFNNIKGQKGDKGDQGDTGVVIDEETFMGTIANNLSTDAADKALSAAQGVVLDGKISQLGQQLTEKYGDYESNPEFVRAYTDNNGKLLWAIKIDGDIYFGAGCPTQVKEYIAEKISELSLDEYEEIVSFLGNLVEGPTLSSLLATKVDIVSGKSLIDSAFASAQATVQNPEWLQTITDNDGKILEGISIDGVKVIKVPVSFPSAEINTDNNPEWLKATTDENGKVLCGISRDGKCILGGADVSQLKDVAIFDDVVKPGAYEIVKPTMTKTEFVNALNEAFTEVYPLVCRCNPLSFRPLSFDLSIGELYADINKNFRERVCVEGMSFETICNRINYYFTQPIYRFGDAKQVPEIDYTEPNIDWSIKAENVDPNIQYNNIPTSEPAVIVSPDGGKLYLYAGGSKPDGRRWETTDGIHFTNETIIEGVCDDTSNYRVDHKNINLIDGVYYLFGVLHDRNDNLINTLILCTSTDGINFTFRGRVFLPDTHIRANMFPNETETDLIAHYYGNTYLLKVESKWYLYFEIEDLVHRRRWEQCLATCTDIFHENSAGEGGGVGTIGNWDFTCGQSVNPNPIFGLGDATGYRFGNVDFARGMDNLPIKHEGKYYLFFHGSYLHETEELKTTAIFRAYSYDLIHWVNEGPCFDNRDLPSDIGVPGNGDQSTIEFKGKVRQYYSWDVNVEQSSHAEIRIISDDRPFCELLKLLP